MIAWKYGIVVAFLLGASVYVSSQYQKDRKQCEKECSQVNGGVPVGVSPAVHAENCDECEKNADRNSPSWYRVFAWPDGVTAWAIILTLMTIAEQTRETRRSALATEHTVKLMADSNSQWLELQTHGLFTRTEVGQPDPPTIITIHPRWKIVNKTPLPLTLNKVSVQIEKGEGWETYIFEFNEIIAPSKGAVFFAPYALTTAETKEFLTTGIELSISISVVFVGVSRVEAQQHFGDFYFCKLGHLEINHPLGKGPQRQYWEKDDDPSTLVTERGFRTLEPDETLPSNPN